MEGIKKEPGAICVYIRASDKSWSSLAIIKEVIDQDSPGQGFCVILYPNGIEWQSYQEELTPIAQLNEVELQTLIDSNDKNRNSVLKKIIEDHLSEIVCKLAIASKFAVAAT